MSCNTLNYDTKIKYQMLGDFDCNNNIDFGDIMSLLTLYIDNENSNITTSWLTFDILLSVITTYIDIDNGTINREEWNRDNLETIIQQTSTSTSTSAPATASTSAPATASASTSAPVSAITQSTNLTSLEKATAKANEILLDPNKKLAIINVLNNQTNNYDIYFKGDEVLEYLITFNSILNASNISKTTKNENIFHNLFSNVTYKNDSIEQAYKIYENKLYQARLNNGDGHSTEIWNNNELIHMFTTNNTNLINDIEKILFADGNEYSNMDMTHIVEIVTIL